MELKSSNGTYYNTVIVDSNTNQIIGAATLIKERKFIHQCANVRINFANLLKHVIQGFYVLERNH